MSVSALLMASAMSLGVASTPPSGVDLGLSFAELSAAYQTGEKTNESGLRGSWKEVSVAVAPACAQVAAQATDWSGIKNADGSVEGLAFDYVNKPVPGPNPIVRIFTVTGTAMSAKGIFQGPFEVNSTEPQFAFWAYTYNGESHDGYFEHSCRFVQDNSSQLICASRLKLVSGDMANSEVNKRCAASAYAYITLYVKGDK